MDTWVLIAAVALVIVLLMAGNTSTNNYRSVYNNQPMRGSGETYRTAYNDQPMRGSGETYGQGDRSLYSEHKPNTYLKPMPYEAVFSNRPCPPPDKQPVPGDQTARSSFPITSSYQPSDAKLPSYYVKYLAANGSIEKNCLKKYMADQIPHENILPSSLNLDGEFKDICPAQENADFRMWPF